MKVVNSITIPSSFLISIFLLTDLLITHKFYNSIYAIDKAC
jgi:hypothetical protein